MGKETADGSFHPWRVTNNDWVLGRSEIIFPLWDWKRALLCCVLVLDWSAGWEYHRVEVRGHRLGVCKKFDLNVQMRSFFAWCV